MTIRGKLTYGSFHQEHYGCSLYYEGQYCKCIKNLLLQITIIFIVPCLLKVRICSDSEYWQKVLQIDALSAGGLSAFDMNTLSFGNMLVFISTYISERTWNMLNKMYTRTFFNRANITTHSLSTCCLREFEI